MKKIIFLVCMTFYIQKAFTQSYLNHIDNLFLKEYAFTINEDSVIDALMINLYDKNKIYMIDTSKKNPFKEAISLLDKSIDNDTLVAIIQKLDKDNYLILFNHRNFFGGGKYQIFIYNKIHNKIIVFGIDNKGKDIQSQNFDMLLVLNSKFYRLAELSSCSCSITEELETNQRCFNGSSFKYKEGISIKCPIELPITNILVENINNLFDSIEAILKIETKCVINEHISKKLWSHILR